MKLGYDVLLESHGQPPEQKPKDWGGVVIIAGDGVNPTEREAYLIGVANTCDSLGWTDDAYHIRYVIIPQSRKEWTPPTPS